MNDKVRKAIKERILEKRRMNQVAKALDPNEVTILSNVQSLISELMGSGAAAGAETVPAEVVKAACDEPDGDKVKKELTTTKSDGATASDDAKERMDSMLSETTNENISGVAKALIGFLKNYQEKPVQKSVSPVIGAIQGMANVQKSVQGQIDDLTAAIGHLITGLGVAEQLKVTKSVEKKGVPIAASENQQMVEFVNSIIAQVNKTAAPVNTYQNNAQVIRKNLTDKGVLRALVANKM